MTTNTITFVQNKDNKDYLQSDMLFIQSDGCITNASEMSIKHFIYIWEKAFEYEGYNLNEIMTKNEIYVVHMHNGFSTLQFTFCPKWGNTITYTIRRN